MKKDKVEVTKHALNGEIVLLSVKGEYFDHTELQVATADRSKIIYNGYYEKNLKNNNLDPKIDMEILCFPWGFSLAEITSISPQNISVHLNFNMTRKTHCNVKFFNYQGEQIASPINNISAVHYFQLISSQKKLNKYLNDNKIKEM